MSIDIRTVDSRRTRRDFLLFPWRIYRGDPNWVPPLLMQMKKIMDPRRNGYLRKGPHRLFVAYKDGAPAGRVMAGVDMRTNKAKGLRNGWFALFESIEDQEVAAGLLDAARNFLAAAGCDLMRGPLAPTGGEDFRGLLIEGFDSPPVLMDSYNPPYYRDLLERWGLAKGNDFLAYRLSYRMPKNPEVVEYAQKRYGFRLDRLNLRRLDREVRDIHAILQQAMPEWPDQIPPSLAEVEEEARTLKQYADPDLVLLARAGDQPIGFCVSMANLNEALAHLNGRLLPFGWLKFLYWRRRIKVLRIFVLFVVPEWRKKGVTAAMYVRIFEEATKRGIRSGEGSTIREENLPMRRDVERIGGEHYKTYRIFRREI